MHTPGAAASGPPSSAQQRFGQPPAQQSPYGQQQQYGQQGPPPAYSQGGYGQSPGHGVKSQYAPPSGAPPPLPQGRPGGGSSYAPPPGPPPALQPGYPGTNSRHTGTASLLQSNSTAAEDTVSPLSSSSSIGAPSSAPPPLSGGSVTFENIMRLLQFTVQDQKFLPFYPTPQSLEPVAHRIVQSGMIQHLSQAWRLPLEIAVDLAKLALCDVVLYIDDSGSMVWSESFEEGGSRIDDAKLIISRVAQACSAFDDDGIQEANALVNQIKFSGLTPLGTALDSKVLQPLVLGPARAGQLHKPILVIAVTDGAPGGEDRYTIVRVLVNASRFLQQTRYGADALSVQLAQIGNDMKARAFLEEIDSHPEVGGLVDCTSNYENEADDLAKQGVELTPELWLVKLLLGGIDSSYDKTDEAR
ncbi:von Willebrand factor, type A domain containing protein [Rhodotorula toruloides]|uniref:von Willebrand factor, type A domain containing protein n=1 Tax=Rhodotorula toruloides TaxID=5286 RepID=A0A511KSJ0_RHOTO|nr:von Willebrand factor, type A domain containing protein [Rhodotorula toruloides]